RSPRKPFRFSVTSISPTQTPPISTSSSATTIPRSVTASDLLSTTTRGPTAASPNSSNELTHCSRPRGVNGEELQARHPGAALCREALFVILSEAWRRGSVASTRGVEGPWLDCCQTAIDEIVSVARFSFLVLNSLAPSPGEPSWNPNAAPFPATPTS